MPSQDEEVASAATGDGLQIDLGNQIVTVVPERKAKPGSIKFFNRQGPDYDDLAGSRG